MLFQAHSAKGIKAIVSLIIDNGVITADSADDAIHSNGTLTINGGSFSLSTGDDGMHADDILTVNNGDVTISKAYEGLESAVIIINGGNLHVSSNDDGVNIAGGKDASGVRPGDTFNSGIYYLAVNGGYLFVDIYGDGDGIDANGAITMTGGQVIVSGSPTLMNCAIDHDGPFNMTGGFILGVGSTGTRIAPAQGPSSTSTQYALLLNLNYSLPAGTLIHLQTGSGAEVFTFSPTRSYKSIAFSSPALTKGTTYDVYYNGSSTGTLKDGLYTGGTYTPGTKYTSFTITTIITKPPSPLPPPF